MTQISREPEWDDSSLGVTGLPAPVELGRLSGSDEAASMTVRTSGATKRLAFERQCRVWVCCWSK